MAVESMFSQGEVFHSYAAHTTCLERLWWCSFLEQTWQYIFKSEVDNGDVEQLVEALWVMGCAQRHSTWHPHSAPYSSCLHYLRHCQMVKRYPHSEAEPSVWILASDELWSVVRGGHDLRNGPVSSAYLTAPQPPHTAHVCQHRALHGQLTQD